MNLLITAGNTLAPIDRVRGLTNVFTGRTGADVALHAHARGHRVVLLTSRPDAVSALNPDAADLGERWTLSRYSTYDDLHSLMERRVRAGDVDALIHSAAVSDYLAAGVYAPAEGTRFFPEDGAWGGAADEPPRLAGRDADKVKSDEPELWLRLTRAPKLIDHVRADWNYRGLLVKFKLEVGLDDIQLLEIAERSRVHSGADLMVANTLEGAGAHAFLGPLAEGYQRLNRGDLSARLLDALEILHHKRTHG
ncbi:MAG TPA: bifunctional phosphopantothenoylcysteine decarboxylase/phosphopantothenate synthase [Planctomycetales bacterium]|jgi:phosphopantothenoylcysteine synthetase/decarboxylase|nr:bifunctional phosphopantothenoylcysteine decarboxylase/phosphopantothenate synthase [Planctomycetales bacterium]